MDLREWFAICSVNATKEATSFQSAYKATDPSVAF